MRFPFHDRVSTADQPSSFVQVRDRLGAMLDCIHPKADLAKRYIGLVAKFYELVSFITLRCAVTHLRLNAR